MWCLDCSRSADCGGGRCIFGLLAKLKVCTCSSIRSPYLDYLSEDSPFTLLPLVQGSPRSRCALPFSTVDLSPELICCCWDWDWESPLVKAETEWWSCDWPACCPWAGWLCCWEKLGCWVCCGDSCWWIPCCSRWCCDSAVSWAFITGCGEPSSPWSSSFFRKRRSFFHLFS